MTCKTKLVKGHFIPARWRASKISEKANTAHFCAGGWEGGARNTSHFPKQNVLNFSWFASHHSALGAISRGFHRDPQRRWDAVLEREKNTVAREVK